MESSSTPYVIRNLVPGDEPFVYASWLHSFEPFRDRRISRDIYYQEHHALIAGLLDKPSGLRIVAASREEPKLLFGFLFGARLSVGTVLDYVFVKPIYRRMGIASALLRELGPADAVTHHTTDLNSLLGLGTRATYDPYLLHLSYR
jgi:GNAT superfamily N-acetyltransferase